MEIMTDETMDQTVKGKHAFVMFYAPWCPHCKSASPIWNDLARLNEENKDVVIGKVGFGCWEMHCELMLRLKFGIFQVDCVEYRPLCEEYEVKGYPSMLWLTYGLRVDSTLKEIPYCCLLVYFDVFLCLLGCQVYWKEESGALPGLCGENEHTIETIP